MLSGWINRTVLVEQTREMRARPVAQCVSYCSPGASLNMQPLYHAAIDSVAAHDSAQSWQTDEWRRRADIHRRQLAELRARHAAQGADIVRRWSKIAA